MHVTSNWHAIPWDKIKSCRLRQSQEVWRWNTEWPGFLVEERGASVQVLVYHTRVLHVCTTLTYSWVIIKLTCCHGFRCFPYLKMIQALWCPFAAQKSWDILSHDDEMIAIKQEKNRHQKKKNGIRSTVVRERRGSPLGFVADRGEGWDQKLDSSMCSHNGQGMEISMTAITGYWSKTFSILLSLSRFYPSVLILGLFLPLKISSISVIYYSHISNDFKATFDVNANSLCCIWTETPTAG